MSGYVELGDAYIRLSLDRYNTLRAHWKFPKADYRNYKHFAESSGKFDPCVIFLGRPIIINEKEGYCIVWNESAQDIRCPSFGKCREVIHSC